jgi:hypothetical protein
MSLKAPANSGEHHPIEVKGFKDVERARSLR